MKDLIKIDLNENQEPIVSGRDLHEILGVETPYRIWFPRMVEYGFTEGIDFIEFEEKADVQNCTRTYEQKNHAIKLDMAKEIAMIQRSEEGKKVRQYFIQVENDFNSPEKIMARALKIANNKLEVLQIENDQQNQLIGELKPKADYTDRILQSKGTTKVNVIANDYGYTAIDFNKLLHRLGIQYKQGEDWLLYREYRGKGYTHSKTFSFKRKNGMTDSKTNMEWTQKGRLFLYEKLKKHDIVPTIEIN